IFIFISFGLGIYNYVEELSGSSSADKILVQARGVGVPGIDESFKLTEDDLHALGSSAGVYDATGVYFSAARVEQKKNSIYTFVIGYDPSLPMMLEVSNIDVVIGRELKKGETGKVILGYNFLKEDVIFPVPYSLNEYIKINGIKMKVVGFLEEIGSPPDDSQIYTTNEYFEELFPNKTYGILVANVDVTDIDKVVENVEKKLRKERGLDEGQEDFFVQSYDDLIESFGMAMNIIIGFVFLIAFISVLVSAVNTANTMITSVLERYKEIGILKAIGAKNSEVFGIFLFESSFLGLVSGLIGVLVGWGLSSIAGTMLAEMGWAFLSPAFPSVLFWGLILFAVVTGAISGAIPAYKASIINTVDALRYE
ncbi:ABC transporter permease, partial [Candidatus Pacearchaeota archaeon]|nr:ABC transporter permease [Candidatus Pacearchaeota archaeon]